MGITARPPRWPIRAKLVLGLSLVAAMLAILLVGAFHGLRSFHGSNLTLVDQLRELGASRLLLERVIRLDGTRLDLSSEAARSQLTTNVQLAREALSGYYHQLRSNTTRGSRVDDGADELRVAFRIDEDLTAILLEVEPVDADHPEPTPILPGTTSYLQRRRAVSDDVALEDVEFAEAVQRAGGDSAAAVKTRVERLKTRALELPGVLFRDFYAVLVDSQAKYLSSRVIVWSSALMVLVLLGALTYLVALWVLYPIRLLHRGVNRVARGAFDFRIKLETGDEMQALAEAFNEMTATIRLTYSDLERQVQERSRALARSERLASVGFLAAGVAHEINNPLASIAFGAEALERRLGSPGDRGDAKALRDYARMVQDEAFRCKRITEKLLDFSRCGEIHREPTDLAALIEDVVEMVRHIGKYRSKSIAFGPRERVVALVDGQEIKQVVLNLVVNALDSLDAGGTLRIGLRRDVERAEMVFRDDGHGMTPEVLDTIFEPFFTTRPQGKGTGLGLSICQRIVAQHEGEITADSAGPGLGATFTVRLPVRVEAASDDSLDAVEPAARFAAAPAGAG